MQNSLPARPSLEQLKKLAKELVRDHEQKKPDALALIAGHLPALAGKSADEVMAYPFALHDAQSVLARQYGFAGWTDLQAYIESLTKIPPGEPTPPANVAAILRTVLEARGRFDYDHWCSVMSEEMKAFVTKERFTAASDRLSGYFTSDYRVTYMGSLQRSGRPIYFWRLWVPGWESDLLIRMALNPAGLISGLLFSDPFDTGINKK